MASRKVNEAVVAYRKQTALEFDVEEARKATGELAVRLSPDDFAEYIRLTRQIDVAASKAEETAEDLKWGLATRRQQFKIALNAAGKDGA